MIGMFVIITLTRSVPGYYSDAVSDILNTASTGWVLALLAAERLVLFTFPAGFQLTYLTPKMYKSVAIVVAIFPILLTAASVVGAIDYRFHYPERVLEKWLRPFFNGDLPDYYYYTHPAYSSTIMQRYTYFKSKKSLGISEGSHT